MRKTETSPEFPPSISTSTSLFLSLRVLQQLRERKRGKGFPVVAAVVEEKDA